ncbi:ribonuclease D [Alteromonas sp. ASW11-130]|uniref:ribonuclease D n=1 Tax=Alteromonas sp. ASW11-130 TaxID=3015775 RepID=UPI002241CA39|nr:ribonuclease D [Alteromonas sp. ASW11-130]MCW8092547.1 ribonuclease D [Alteromonas sp. ASW11-130]
MHYQLISDDRSLADVCRRASNHRNIALDTEFVRTRTLTPQLGLIQLYDGEQLVLIDPLPINDFTPFVDLIRNQEITKILHSCSEDIEAFLTFFGVAPSPIFDTQFAANILGLGATIGYGRLIDELLGIQLDKGEARTDWLARPLSEKQLHYAANDVLYLLPAYDKLATQVDELNKRDWVVEEISYLTTKKKAQLPSEWAYLQVKNNWKLNQKQIYVLKNLASWRLERAREKDMALNFVIKETSLIDLVQILPTDKLQLAKIPGIAPQVVRKQGDTLLAVIKTAVEKFDQLEDNEKPDRIKRLIDVHAYKKYAADLKALALNIAESKNVQVEVLASKKQINQLLKWWWFDEDETSAQGLAPDLLSGWRGKLFSAGVIELLGDIPDNKRHLLDTSVLV